MYSVAAGQACVVVRYHVCEQAAKVCARAGAAVTAATVASGYVNQNQRMQEAVARRRGRHRVHARAARLRQAQYAAKVAEENAGGRQNAARRQRSVYASRARVNAYECQMPARRQAQRVRWQRAQRQAGGSRQAVRQA